jgi:hypothetical protein
MEDYYFRLVCVDEQNPLYYHVLVDETLETLEDVHTHVKENIKNNIPDISKWILIPIRKKGLIIRESV